MTEKETTLTSVNLISLCPQVSYS